MRCSETLNINLLMLSLCMYVWKGNGFDIKIIVHDWLFLSSFKCTCYTKIELLLSKECSCVSWMRGKRSGLGNYLKFLENYLSDSQRFQETEWLILLAKSNITSCSDNFLSGSNVELNARLVTDKIVINIKIHKNINNWKIYFKN